MSSKFKVSETVQVNGRCPKYILNDIRHNRKRTISGVFYQADKQCCFYTLGSNHWANSMDYGWVYFFRSYQLSKPIKGRKAGRPRQKRKYNHHTKSTIKSPNQPQGRLTTFGILEDITSLDFEHRGLLDTTKEVLTNG